MAMTLAPEHCWQKTWSYTWASNYSSLLTRVASYWVFVMVFRCLCVLDCSPVGTTHRLPPLKHHLQASPITHLHSSNAAGLPCRHSLARASLRKASTNQ